MSTNNLNTIKQADQNPENKSINERSENTQVMTRPAVDIHENQECLSLIADLPGVLNEDLNIQVDGETLVIEGVIKHEQTSNRNFHVFNMRTTKYRRAFKLSPELDTSKIEARLKSGVLTLKIPKISEALPRRIEVQAA